MRTLLWTVDGDIEMTGTRIRAAAGHEALNNRIYVFLRQSTALDNQFRISDYIGSVQTPAKARMLEQQLARYLDYNLFLDYPVEVTVSTTKPNTFDVAIVIFGTTEIDETFGFAYKSGSWHMAGNTTTTVELSVPPPNNLMGR